MPVSAKHAAPARRARQRAHRNPGADPVAEDHRHPGDREDPARQPTPPEPFLPMREREHERKNRNRGEQDGPEPSGDTLEPPVGERERRAEPQHPVEHRAEESPTARHPGSEDERDHREDRGGDQEARRGGPERIELARLARDVPDRDDVAACEGHEQTEGHEGDAVGPAAPLGRLRHGHRAYPSVVEVPPATRVREGRRRAAEPTTPPGRRKTNSSIEMRTGRPGCGRPSRGSPFKR